AHRAEPEHVGGLGGELPRAGDGGVASEVVDVGGRDVGHEPPDRGGVFEVGNMPDDPGLCDREAFTPVSAVAHGVHFVAVVEQPRHEVAAILPVRSGDEMPLPTHATERYTLR